MSKLVTFITEYTPSAGENEFIDELDSLIKTYEDIGDTHERFKLILQDLNTFVGNLDEIELELINQVKSFTLWTQNIPYHWFFLR